MKINQKNNRLPHSGISRWLVMSGCLALWCIPARAQVPEVTIQFANPTFDCELYCVDVQFMADSSDVYFDAMNIRFFYPDDLLEFYGFTPVDENYFIGDIDVLTSESAGPALFNFDGGADFVNGSISVINPEMAMEMDSDSWTTLFEVCFTIDDPNSNGLDFCPSLVWDLEADPAEGGFFPGDDGVVIVVFDSDMNSESSNEHVVQFNWEYIGNGDPPYGQPVADSCIVFDCPLFLACAADTSVSCHTSVSPDYTGWAIITDYCPGDTTLTYVDSTASGSCPNDYTIYRTWEATNLCGDVATCIQIIEVIDTIGPDIMCPPIMVECADQVPSINLSGVTATDLCPGNVIITFEGEIISEQTCANQFVITRTFSATDECGNSSTCTQTITVLDESGPFITCPPDLTVQCAGLVPAPDPGGVSSWDYCGGSTINAFVGDDISNQTCPNNYIITRTYSATDECGNTSTCAQIISVMDNIPPTITTCAVTRNFEGCDPGVITDPPYSAIPAASSETEFEDATNQGVASDLCGIASVMYSDAVAGTCPIVVTRTWTVSDACGLTATCTQTINIEDTMTPVISTCAVDRSIDDCDLSSITDPPYSAIPAASSEAEFENGINQGDASDCNITTVTYIDVAVGSCPTIVTRTWTISDACGNAATCNQTITICSDPGSADAGPDQHLCNETTTTLAAITPLIGTGTWSVINGTADITDPSSPTSEVTGLIPGASVELEWTVTNGPCSEYSDQMTITIDELPTTADAGFNRLTCDTFTNAIANTPIVGTGLWTVVSGTATLATPDLPTTIVSGLVNGTVTTLQWTITNGICPASSDQMTISVLTDPDAGPDQVLCTTMNSTTLAANPVTVGEGFWYVASGMATITDYSDPATTVMLTPGVATELVWFIFFPPEGCDRQDTMTITWTDPPTIADAGDSQILCDETTTTLNANVPTTGTGLWTVIDGVAILTDPSSPTSEVTGLVPGTTAVLEWSITNGGCTPSLDYILIEVEIPQTSDAGPDQYLCNYETSTTVTGTTPLYGPGMWFLISGTATITDPSSPTTEITDMSPAAPVVLHWTINITEDACPPGIDEVVIYFDDPPTDADAGSDQELCNLTTSTLAANTPLLGTGTWSVAMGTANVTDPSSPTSEVTGLIPGTSVTLEWIITNGSCGSSSDQVTITVDELPSPSNAGPDQQFCNLTTTTLAANTPMVGNGLWSVVSGTANISDPASPTSGVTGLVPGMSATLQWTITNGICASSNDVITIVVDELPTTSNAGADQELCNLTTTSLSANTPSIGNGLWTVISGTAIITDPTSPTSGVTGLVPGTTATLEWLVTNETCPASTDQMIIIVDALPSVANAGPDQQLCNQTTTTLAANTPSIGTGLWSVISGTANITNPASPTSGVTGMVIGNTVVLQWAITNGTCPSSTDQVTINLNALPTSSNAGPDQQMCNLTTTTLSANTPVVGTGLWSVVSGTASITNPSSPVSGVTGLIPGTTVTLAWSVTNGNCPSSVDQVAITVYALPTTSNAGPDQSLCNLTTTTLSANTPSIGTGMWSVISGTANITNPTSPTSGVTGLTNGSSVVLQWSITNGTCPPSIDQMMITAYALPTPSNAGPDKELCNLTTTTLSGNNPPVGSGQWTVISGTANITNPSSPASGVTGLVPGTNVTLQWSIINGVCPASTDQMTITNYELPTTANAGPDQQFCNLTTTTLAANTPLEGDGLWTVINGTATVTNPSSPISGITGLIPGTSATLQWKISNGSCPASIDQVKITVDELPSPADAGPDMFLCDQSATIINAETPLVGNGLWTIVNGNGTILNPDQPSTAVVNLLTGTTTTLEWTVTNGTCPSNSDQLIIDVSDFPTQADAGPDQSVCQSTTTFLQANEPMVGTGSWLIISGPGDIIDPESPTSEITGLQADVPTIAQWTIWNSFCQPSSDEVTITITEADDQADAGPDQLICGETSVLLTANAPVNGSGYWTIVQGVATINDSNNPTAEVTDLISGETVILEWTITSGDCPPSSDQVNIFVDVSTGFADAGPDLSFCAQELIMVEGNMPPNGNGVWTLISGIAELLNANEPVVQLQNFVAGTSIVLQWTVFNGTCPPDSDQVEIFLDASPTAAEAGFDLDLCEESQLQLSANSPLIGLGHWSVISGNASITDPSSPTTTLSGLIPGTTTVLEWSIGNGVCPLSTDQLSVHVYALPSASDAGTDQVLCNQTSTSLSANPPAIGQGSWTILDGSATLADSLSPSTSINDLQPGTTVTLQWTVTNGVCQESSDLVTIQVNQETSAAVAGPDQVLCGDASTIIQANTPEFGQGQWSITNGNATIADPLSPVTELMDLQPGTTVTLQWTVSNGACPSTSDELTIEINEAPSTADAGDDQAFCEQTEGILNANAPTVGTGQWEILSGSGSLADLSHPSTTVTGLDPGSPLVLQWVTTYESCESKDTITISTYEVPTPANAGEDQSLCATETVLNANTPLIGQGSWAIVSGAGTLANTSLPTTSITGLIPGELLVLQWNIANGVCPESSDEVTIWVETEAPVAMAGDDQHLCEETITTIQALPANVGTGSWAILSGSGTIQDSSSASTSVSGLLPGTTILRWMVSGTACPPAHDDIIITIDETPDPADAGPDVSICSSELMLSAVEPLIGTGAWTILNGLGSLQNQFDPFTFLTDVPPGTSISLEWKITNGICPSVADTITITTSLPPDTPVAIDDMILCNSTHATLSGNHPGPGGGTGTWSILSGAGVIENVNDSLTAVTGLAFGTNLFVWTISNGVCAPLSDTVVIQNNDHAELKSNFLVSEFACTGDSVHMFDISGNATLPSGFFWDFGDNTTSTERDPIHVYAQQGDYTITLTTTLEGCGSVSTSKVIRVFNCLSNNPGNGGTRKVLYVNVVPNPSDEDFKVSVKLREESEVIITLFDAVGRITEARKIINETDIKEIFHVEVPGLYFFHIQVGLEVLIFKVVKVEGSN